MQFLLSSFLFFFFKQGLACEVVLGLPDVHPVSGEGEGVEAAVPTDEREGLLLDAGRPQLDPVQHLGAQDVDACVDLVAHKGLHHSRAYALLHTQAKLNSWDWKDEGTPQDLRARPKI